MTAPDIPASPEETVGPRFVPGRFEWVALDDLEPHPRNANSGDVGAITGSVETLGFYGLILCRPFAGHYQILAGEHRWRALRQLGASRAPCWVMDDVDDETALRVLNDNRFTRLGHDQTDVLVENLRELAATPVGLDGTGFDGDDLDHLLADLANELTGEDAGPTEPPAEPVTKPGDLWVLGDHRLLCGDARNADDYAKLLEGGSPGLVVTDPPYGVAIGDKNAVLNSVGRGNPHEGPLEGDQGMDAAEALWRAAFPQIRASLSPGTSYYVFGPQGGGLGELLLLLLRESGMEARHILIWVKDRPVFSLGRLDYEYQHEPICYGWVPGAAHSWYTGDPQSSVIQVDRPAASKLHPTMKPVEVFVPLIRNSAAPGATVLDPFAGSGTTAVACEQLGRRARLLEIDPGYCDVIVQRWERLTGGTAERLPAPASS